MKTRTINTLLKSSLLAWSALFLLATFASLINPKPLTAAPQLDNVVIKGVITVTDNTGFESEFDVGDAFIYEIVFDKNSLASSTNSFSATYTPGVSSAVLRPGSPNSGKWITGTHNLSSSNVNVNVNGDAITFQLNNPSPGVPNLGGVAFLDVGLSYSYSGVYDFTLPGGDNAFKDVTGAEFDFNDAVFFTPEVRNASYQSPSFSHEFYFAGGDGTAASPFQIANWHHLDRVREGLTAYYELANDLDAETAGYAEHVSDGGVLADSSRGWKPIGTFPGEFIGSFDGKGYMIKELMIQRPAEERVGLFGRIGNTIPSVVKDVHLRDGQVQGKHLVGLIAGQLYGTVENSSAWGVDLSSLVVGGPLFSESTGYSIGGLVGQVESSGTVRESYARALVSGGFNVGGLVGSNSGTISDSYAFGLSGAYTGAVGGLVGSHGYGATIDRSYSAGPITYLGDPPSRAGGLIGEILVPVLSNNKNGAGNGVTASFWNKTIAGVGKGIAFNQTDSLGVVGVTSEQMRSKALFTDAGWDFTGETTNGSDDIWAINPTGYASFPYFANMTYDAPGTSPQVSPIHGLVALNVFVKMDVVDDGAGLGSTIGPDVALYRPADGDGRVPAALSASYNDGAESFIQASGADVDFSYDSLAVSFDVSLAADYEDSVNSARLVFRFDKALMELNGDVGTLSVKGIEPGPFFTAETNGGSSLGPIYNTRMLDDVTIDGTVYSKVEVTASTISGNAQLYNAGTSTANTNALLRLSFLLKKGGASNVTLDLTDYDLFKTLPDGDLTGNLTISTADSGAVEFYAGDTSSAGASGVPDGKVDFADLTGFASAYFTTTDSAAYRLKYDIGSTTVTNYYNLPESDGEISFRDLISFATGYTLSLDRVVPLSEVEAPLALWLGEARSAGNGVFEVPVMLGGTVSAVSAMQVRLEGMDGLDGSNGLSEGVTILGVERGDLFAGENGFAATRTIDGITEIDAATLGFNSQPLQTSGVALTILVESNEHPLLAIREAQLVDSNGQNLPFELTNGPVDGDGTDGNDGNGIDGAAGELPQAFDLSPNYPNPFNPSTSIRYALPEASDVQLEVYNITGQRIATLVNASQSAGTYEVSFDASKLSSGVYLYRLTAGTFTQTRQMMLVK